MSIKRCAITVWLCAIAAGCGGSNPQVSPSSVKTAAPLIGGDATAPRLGVQSIGSCPDGNAPSWLQTWTKGTAARLRWTEVAPEIEYHVVIERYDVSNTFVPVENGDFFIANQTWAERTLGEGSYRAKIQTRSCGHFMGPWSDELVFSVEGEEAAVVTPPPPPASSESPEGTKVGPATSITDASAVVWTLGAVVSTPFGNANEVARNGIVWSGVWATELKYHNHSVYIHGPDTHWYLVSGASLIDVGTTEP
jgi:hypothetical protein